MKKLLAKVWLTIVVAFFVAVVIRTVIEVPIMLYVVGMLIAAYITVWALMEIQK